MVELTGGSPAYARQRITWNSPATGNVGDASVAAAINVPAGATTNYISFHSASSAGTLLAVAPASSVETFAGQGTYTVTDAELDLMAAA